ncbi:MAG TPA: hypothetical protein VN894_13780 [Polyangiaceae bacterium]|nr:hypothetical protein [Polyangiaceae bacterium]
MTERAAIQNIRDRMNAPVDLPTPDRILERAQDLDVVLAALEHPAWGFTSSDRVTGARETSSCPCFARSSSETVIACASPSREGTPRALGRRAGHS